MKKKHSSHVISIIIFIVALSNTQIYCMKKSQNPKCFYTRNFYAQKYQKNISYNNYAQRKKQYIKHVSRPNSQPPQSHKTFKNFKTRKQHITRNEKSYEDISYAKKDKKKQQKFKTFTILQRKKKGQNRLYNKLLQEINAFIFPYFDRYQEKQKAKKQKKLNSHIKEHKENLSCKPFYNNPKLVSFIIEERKKHKRRTKQKKLLQEIIEKATEKANIDKNCFNKLYSDIYTNLDKLS